MRKFFICFLGSMAALWVTIIIGVLGLIALIGAVSIKSAASGMAKTEVKEHSVLHLDLSVPIVEQVSEKPSILSLLQGDFETPVQLEDILKAIDRASTDKKIDGIYIEGGICTAGLAQSQAIISALQRFKSSGKWIYAYADDYTQTSYFIASVADSVFLNPVGMVDIHGLGSSILYYKDFLDKIGIGIDIVRVGTYKSAVEPFSRNDMSDASREQIQAYLASIWNSMRNTIGDNRHVESERVNAWADSLMMFQRENFYLAEKVVDRLIYRHQMDSILTANSHGKHNKDPRLINLEQYVASDIRKSSALPSSSKHIAVLYAEGEISTSAPEGIASDKIIPEIESLMKNDKVAGLILRVNSPGGSAFASEQIWEALQEYKRVTGNPFFVSMGDVAASGGYYISCGADRIYAEPVTITGSIGIFGMIPNASDLLNNKLGIHPDEVYTNPKGALPNLLSPMTPTQKASMQGYVNRGYELFTKRCADGRHMSQDSIKVIAEGRVWDGATALKIGLVDKLGGLNLAIADMSQQLGLSTDDVESYPRNQFGFIYQIMQLSSTIETVYVRKKLGGAYPLYEQVQRLSETSVLQTRMESSLPQ